MKTEKMSLANIQGKLSRTEMRTVMAGSGSGGGSTCDATDKITACNGKKVNDSCCWKYNGSNSYGTCQGFPPDYTLHCSNLN